MGKASALDRAMAWAVTAGGVALGLIVLVMGICLLAGCATAAEPRLPLGCVADGPSAFCPEDT